MNDDIHSLSGAFVLDALDPDERERFLDHLAACGACQQEVDELAGVVEPLSAAVAEPPPPSLRASTLAAIDEIRPLPPIARPDPAPSAPAGATTNDSPSGRSRRSPVTWVVAAAAVVVAILAAVALIGPWGGGDEPTVASVIEAEDAREHVQRLDGFTATLVVSEEEDRAVLVSDDMPPAPSGHAYQLWYARPGDDMVSAGVMPASDDGQRVLLDGELGDATAVGITVEPAGGSDAPTTEPLAVIPIS